MIRLQQLRWLAGSSRSVFVSASTRRLRANIALTVLFGVLLTACERDESQVKSERISESALAQTAGFKSNGYIFSFDLRTSPQQDARQYQGLIDYLNERTGYHFELRFTPRDGSLAKQLEDGTIHLAAVGAVTYLQAAAQQSGLIPLVRGKNSQNKARYRAVFVVRPDSPIRRIDELRGRSLAFGAVDSTQGHLIPRIMLAQQGVTLNQLEKYEYTGSHKNCAEAVLSRRFDACGLQDTLAERLVKENQLRILAQSNDYPSSGIVASPALPVDVRVKVLQALLDFDPLRREKSRLYQWERSEMPNGFVVANPGDYDELKQWLERLNLLSMPKEKRQ